MRHGRQRARGVRCNSRQPRAQPDIAYAANLDCLLTPTAASRVSIGQMNSTGAGVCKDAEGDFEEGTDPGEVCRYWHGHVEGSNFYRESGCLNEPEDWETERFPTVSVLAPHGHPGLLDDSPEGSHAALH